MSCVCSTVSIIRLEHAIWIVAVVLSCLSITEPDSETFDKFFIVMAEWLSLRPESTVAYSRVIGTLIIVLAKISVSIAIPSTEVVRAIWSTSCKVSALWLVSARILVPFWIIVRGDSWLFPVDDWLLLSSLEEPGPDSLSVWISAVVLEIRSRCRVIVKIARINLTGLLSNNGVIHNRDAYPKRPTIMFTARSSYSTCSQIFYATY